MPKETTPAEFEAVLKEEAELHNLVQHSLRQAVREELTFNELKSLFDVSDGNLSAHARKLEEARYLSCTKSFEQRRPKTVYRLTALGKNALNRYLDHIEAVIKATRRM